MGQTSSYSDCRWTASNIFLKLASCLLLTPIYTRLLDGDGVGWCRQLPLECTDLFGYDRQHEPWTNHTSIQRVFIARDKPGLGASGHPCTRTSARTRGRMCAMPQRTLVRKNRVGAELENIPLHRGPLRACSRARVRASIAGRYGRVFAPTIEHFICCNILIIVTY